MHVHPVTGAAQASCARLVERDLERSLATVGELVRQPSVSTDGRGIAACADLVADVLRRYGFTAEVIQTPGHPVVLGELGEGPRTLLLYCHYDVQPPEPLELWTTPPFETHLRDGRIYGRGTADDKGCIVSRAAAIAAYVETHGP